MRIAILLACLAATSPLGIPQDAYKLAPDNYRLLFENEYTRVSKVLYRPREVVKFHTHPEYPTVYVYLTDSGPVRFFHAAGAGITRATVKAGAIRFSRASAETHEVESLSEIPSEFVRIELKTEALDVPDRDVRLPPEAPGFENGQIKIEKFACPTQERCRVPDNAGVVVALKSKTAYPASTSWINNLPESEQLTVVTFKTKPIARASKEN